MIYKGSDMDRKSYGRIDRLQVIRPFDPWRSDKCTCMPKYSLHPYTGCSHFCLYCYATAYIGRKPSIPKRDFLRRVLRDLRFINSELVIELSSSSDPYPPIEEWMLLTRRTLEILADRSHKILITTKSHIVARDWDILLKTPSTVMITITTLNEELAKKIEPGAPPPNLRLKTISMLRDKGIPVGVRIDPIIPGLNDKPEELVELVKQVVEHGALHIVTSTYKARPDNLRRMMNAFPDKKKSWVDLYLRQGEHTHGYYYLPRELRFKLLKPVIETATKYGVTAAVCREAFPELFRAPSCDGQHLIKLHPRYSSRA